MTDARRGPSDPDHTAHSDVTGVGSSGLFTPDSAVPAHLITDISGFQIPDHLAVPRYSYGDIVGLPPRKMIDYITGDLLEIENHNFTQGNTAFHKLAFLIGGRDRDVSKVEGPNGESVYRGDPEKLVFPEILEFLAAVNFHQRKKPDMPGVLSEAADIVFNLIMLTKLDRPRAAVYQEALARFTNALGYTPKEALVLTTIKYHARYVEHQRKNPQAEDELIDDLLRDVPGRAHIISTPTDRQLKEACGAISRVEAEDLIPRMRAFKSNVGYDSTGWEDWSSG